MKCNFQKLLRKTNDDFGSLLQIQQSKVLALTISNDIYEIANEKRGCRVRPLCLDQSSHIKLIVNLINYTTIDTAN